MLTANQLATIAGRPINDNMRSIVSGLDARGALAGLGKPHRLAHFIAQLSHESMGFFYDGEVWGPTAAQKRYDTRTDLGNTAARDGDGFLYRGRGPIQITGKSNYAHFTKWARANDARAPDFVANPDAVNTDPWEGLGPIWYWETHSLNGYADANNIEMITRRINGGLNGFDDRVNRYTRTALVMLGYSPSSVRGFQSDHGLVIDGIAGPNTRADLHGALMDRPASLTLTPPNKAPAAPVATGGFIAAILAALAAFFTLKKGR